MIDQTRQSRTSLIWWVVGGFMISSMLAAGGLQAAPRPKPKPRPKAKPKAGPKPGPRAGKPHVHRPTGKSPRARTVRPKYRSKAGYRPYAKASRWRAKHHYWHPVYAPKATKYVYTTTGYPYYVGGSSYTVVEQPVATETTETVSAASVSMGEEAAAYGNMLEVTEMVHEWRTLNESAEFQKRIEAARSGTSSESKALLTKIKDLNARFDQQTRETLQDLASGKDATGKVSQARTTLESLMAVADALPAAS